MASGVPRGFRTPFGPPILTKIDQLKAVYGLTLTAADAHKLTDQP